MQLAAACRIKTANYAAEITLLEYKSDTLHNFICEVLNFLLHLDGVTIFEPKVVVVVVAGIG